MKKEYLDYLKEVKRNLTYIFVVELYKNKGNIEKTIKDFNNDINDESKNINKLIDEKVQENLKDACKNELFKKFENTVIEVMDTFFNEKTGLITNNKQEEVKKLMEEAIEYQLQQIKQTEKHA